METIYSSLEILFKLGLVQERKRSSFPFTIEVLLTDKGRRVAECFDEIEKEPKRMIFKNGAKYVASYLV